MAHAKRRARDFYGGEVVWAGTFRAYRPEVVQEGQDLTHQIGHESDVMATCLDVAGVKYREEYKGHEIIPLEGKSLVPIFQGKHREGH